jgi:GNAT superfamily N-acetyltransferase
VRPARGDDATRLAELQVAAWWAAYGAYVEHEKIARTAQRVPGAWRERLAGAAADDRDAGEHWVLEAEDTLVGWVAVGPSRDRDARPGDGELRAIYVHPERIGQGHGHALLEQGEARLAGLGHRGATLWVFTENAPARAFYERHGWALDDRPGVNPWDDWGPCLRYRKELA